MHARTAALLLTAILTMCIVGCPQPTELGPEPPSSDLTPGIYSGTASLVYLETERGTVVTQGTTNQVLPVIVNDLGQVVSPASGRPFRVGDPITLQMGTSDLTITPTAVSAAGAAVVVVGNVTTAILGVPATGSFMFSYRGVDASALDASGTYLFATAAGYAVEWQITGRVTK